MQHQHKVSLISESESQPLKRVHQDTQLQISSLGEIVKKYSNTTSDTIKLSPTELQSNSNIEGWIPNYGVNLLPRRIKSGHGTQRPKMLMVRTSSMNDLTIDSMTVPIIKIGSKESYSSSPGRPNLPRFSNSSLGFHNEANQDFETLSVLGSIDLPHIDNGERHDVDEYLDKIYKKRHVMHQEISPIQVVLQNPSLSKVKKVSKRKRLYPILSKSSKKMQIVKHDMIKKFNEVRDTNIANTFEVPSSSKKCPNSKSCEKTRRTFDELNDHFDIEDSHNMSYPDLLETSCPLKVSIHSIVAPNFVFKDDQPISSRSSVSSRSRRIYPSQMKRLLESNLALHPTTTQIRSTQNTPISQNDEIVTFFNEQKHRNFKRKKKRKQVAKKTGNEKYYYVRRTHSNLLQGRKIALSPNKQGKIEEKFSETTEEIRETDLLIRGLASKVQGFITDLEDTTPIYAPTLQKH